MSDGFGSDAPDENIMPPSTGASDGRYNTLLYGRRIGWVCKDCSPVLGTLPFIVNRDGHDAWHSKGV